MDRRADALEQARRVIRRGLADIPVSVALKRLYLHVLAEERILQDEEGDLTTLQKVAWDDTELCAALGAENKRNLESVRKRLLQLRGEMNGRGLMPYQSADHEFPKAVGRPPAALAEQYAVDGLYDAGMTLGEIEVAFGAELLHFRAELARAGLASPAPDLKQLIRQHKPRDK